MANKKTFTSGYASQAAPHYWIELIVEEISTNKEENTSKIKFDLRARSHETWDLEFSPRKGTIDADGKTIKTSYTNLAAYDGDGGKYNKRICTITKEFKHKSDGTLSIDVKGYFDYSGILISHQWWLSAVSVTGKFTCTKIANTPTLTLSSSATSPENASIGWKSNLSIAEVQLYDGSGQWIKTYKLDLSSKNGILALTGLTAATKYTYGVKVKTTAGAWSSLKYVTFTTASTATITSSVDLIFGNSLTVTKSNNSGLQDDLYFYVEDQLITTKYNVSNSYTLTFTQAELDTMYRLFGADNSALIKMVIVTKGSKSNYYNTKYGYLTLTGIAKTVHVGVNNSAKRGMVWVGVNRVPKRAVVWFGANGPKRCI